MARFAVFFVIGCLIVCGVFWCIMQLAASALN